jgi:dienelactone hydrolase
MRNQTLTLFLTASAVACSGDGSGTDTSDTSVDSGSADTDTAADTGSGTDSGSAADGSGEGSAPALLPSLRLRGPHTFATTADELVDETRPFPAGSGETAEPRRLPVTIWHPSDAAAPGPVIIWAHGLGSTRSDNRKTAEILASRGYIVAAADFPKTNRLAQPPDVADVVNQPGDLKLLADRVLELGTTAGSPLEGRVDAEKMAYVGLSLGAMTVMLAAWQTEFYDPRIDAVVALAPPSCYMPRPLFETPAIPALVMLGTGDAIVDYASSIASFAEIPAPALVVSLERGSHTAFADVVSDFFNNVPHPDVVGCSSVVSDIDVNSLGTLAESLGGASAAVVNAECVAPCTTNQTETPAMRSGRQAELMIASVVGFLDGVFVPGAASLATLGAALESEPDITVETHLNP